MNIWRDSSRPATFFGLDARAVFPLVLFMLHIRWWTFYSAIVAALFFGFLGRIGWTVPVCMRFVRSYLAGSRRSAVPWWKR